MTLEGGVAARRLPPFFMSLPDPASPSVLRATAITKVYHVVPRLRSLIAPNERSARTDAGRVEALSEVSLTVAPGEAVAVIGVNGAGKSSLLRILAGLSLPTSGSVERTASLGTLLDLGAGLIDEWTGAANAESALALQGEPATRIEEIDRFAELGPFFRQPVRTYSTGMRLRLAYALAIGLSPRILVADEIVAVGDEAFQRRCALELHRFLGEGGTMVLATHNLYLAEKLCARTLWLERGRVRHAGPTRDVTGAYRDAAMLRSSARPTAVAGSIVPSGDRPIAPSGSGDTYLTIESAADEGGRNVVTHGNDLTIRVGPATSMQAEHRWVDLRRADGTLVSRFHPLHGCVELASCNLLPGRFVVELCERAGDSAAVRVRASETLLVRGARRELGCVLLEHEWL